MQHDAPVTATRLVDARLRVTAEVTVEIPTQLAYEATDPYAVKVRFLLEGEQAPVDWVLSRDLLRDGLHRPAGQGDVQLRPTTHGGADEVELVLLAVTGRQARVNLPAPPVRAFLLATQQVVPPGDESEHLDVDTAIMRLLSH